MYTSQLINHPLIRILPRSAAHFPGAFVGAVGQIFFG
jgi:hypothetical protein